MNKPKHKLHDGELPSDVSELRGMISGQLNRDIPGYLIQDHPNSPAILITKISTGKSIEVGLCDAHGALKVLKFFNP
jgi:hypothetical protein